MLKKIFGKKNKSSEVQRDNWIKRDYILVPNDTKPSDLKEYQKLIVLRKPEGEQRCIVDYSLPFHEVDKLHLDSLENTVDLKTDLFDKNLKRIIPTYLNTKEVDDDLNNTDWDEITYSSKSIREASDLFRIADEEFAHALVKVPNKEIPIIRLDEENGQVLLTKLEIHNYERQEDLTKLNIPKREGNENNAIEEIEIDDIDGVDILTEKDLEIRDTWSEVDYYFESKEKVEKRKIYSDVDLTLSPFYVPKVQPLFRNFIDVNFHTDDVLGKLKGNDTTLYEQDNDVFISENEDPVIEKYNDEFVDFSENATSEEPEMIIGDLAIDNSPISIEQPKVLSFFKNEVSTNNKGSFGQSEHINKHSKFYNAKNSSNGRNIKYEKIVLNKKRGIFNIRRTISKE